MGAFRQNPDRAVADLFSGRAGVGSGFRLDVPEILYQAFPAELADDRNVLDGVLLRWLLKARADHPAQMRRLGASAYAKRLVDALATIQLVDLPSSRARIREDLDAWLRWLTPLRLAPDRDPALECWRLVAGDQRSIGDAATWLRLAGDPRTEYFSVAWVGLKLLPNNGDARRNQLLMVYAAIRHATVTSHGDIGTARRSCRRHFGALRGLFPRNPHYWDHVLVEVTDNIIECETGFSRELAHKLRPPQGNDRVGHRRSPTPEERPNTQAEFALLQSDIDHDPSSDDLPRRLFELSTRNLRFAEATGESYYFVRTLVNLGTQLLKGGTLDEEELVEFGGLIERALAWEPSETYAWGLWAEWFMACGNLPAQEWTLREMGRLFPDDEYCRVELARLLMDHGAGNWDESEYWLRQAVERNPDKVHSHVELARMLGRRGKDAEVIQLLDDVLERYPTNAVALSVRQNVGHGPFVQPRQSATPGPKPVASESPLIRELARRAQLTGAFNRATRVVNGSQSTSTLLIAEEAARGDSLAGFYAQWLKLDGASEGPPPHAWAWNACRQWQERSVRDDWGQLADRFPEAATETEFLRTLAATCSPGMITKSPNPTNTRSSLSGTGAAGPTASFIRDTLERLDHVDNEQREDIALAVLASGAVGSLEFMGTTPQ